VHDHLLPLERGVQVRNDSDLPTRRIGRASFGECERLGRRAVLAPVVERTTVEILGGLLVELWARDAGPVAAPRCDYDLAT
jgi:hypothetical protein